MATGDTTEKRTVWWRNPFAIGGVIAFLFTAVMSILNYDNSIRQLEQTKKSVNEENRLLRGKTTTLMQENTYKAGIAEELDVVNVKIDEDRDWLEAYEIKDPSIRNPMQREIDRRKAEITSLEKRRARLEELLK